MLYLPLTADGHISKNLVDPVERGLATLTHEEREKVCNNMEKKYESFGTDNPRDKVSRTYITMTGTNVSFNPYPQG